MDTQFIDNVLKFIEVSNAFAKKASEELAIHRQAKKRAGDLQSKVLENLCDAGLIPDSQKQAALSMLDSHAETLQLFDDAVTKYKEVKNTKTAHENGRAQDPREAGISNGDDYNWSLKTPFLGRRTHRKKASDVVFEEILQDPV